MANDILNDLYYGQVAPWEQQLEDIDKLNELNHKMAELRDILNQRIDKETQELRNRYLSDRSEMEDLLALDRFKTGFRLGAQLMQAVHKEP